MNACDVVCSIPIGRLQESLSLSHAVSLGLFTLYIAHLQHSASPTVRSAQDMAVGFEAATAQGLER